MKKFIKKKYINYKENLKLFYYKLKINDVK